MLRRENEIIQNAQLKSQTAKKSEKQKNEKIINMIDINSTISVIMLNINVLTASIQRLSELITSVCCLQEAQFKYKDT